MLNIRLARRGSKKRPFYRIVVSDSSSGRGGAIVESLGTYEPKREDNAFDCDKGRIEYWIGKGAQASDTVRSLLKKTSS